MQMTLIMKETKTSAMKKFPAANMTFRLSIKGTVNGSNRSTDHM